MKGSINDCHTGTQIKFIKALVEHNLLRKYPLLDSLFCEMRPLLDSLFCENAPPVGLDLHLFLSLRKKKIYVGTSVCTGASKCPPDTCTAMGSSPTFGCNKKDRAAFATLSFLAPPVGLEPTTCGLTVRRSTD